MAEKKKRKLLSEMTPYERIESRMKGMSWEEAEEVGVEVLARCIAYHAYVEGINGDFFRRLSERICRRSDEWAHSDYGRHYLAMARIGRRLKDKEGS